MKKFGAIVLVLMLLATTVVSYGGYLGHGDDVDSGIITQVKSFEDIRLALKETGRFDGDYYRGGMKLFGSVVFDAASDSTSGMDDMDYATEESVMADGTFNSSADLGEGFSSTNVQIEGIDEADVIKTDGEYLYIAADQTFYIVKLLDEETSEMELVTSYNIDENSYISNIFIDEGRLIVFGNRYTPEIENKEVDLGVLVNDSDIIEIAPKSKVLSDEARILPDVSYDGVWFNQVEQTFVKVYDITDAAEPELIQDVAVDGNYRAARKAGNFVYIVANDYIRYYEDIDKAEPGDIMPYYSDTMATNGERTIMPVEDVFICPVTENSSFTNVAVINILGNMPAKIQSYMGSMTEFYMNKESAFMTFSNYDWEAQTQTTDIIALDVNGMDIRYRAEGTVEGSMLNQFSMDEYNGYFRIATTSWLNEEGSNVFVLDKNLDIVGEVRNIAEGEQIYSVRFMGDRGYVVTFETMDPFFTLDLSDPENPYIAGELKLPGYSNYLHQIDENTVLGIGRDTRETYVKNDDGTETVVGFVQGGIKLSLFDISDFANPAELNSFVIGTDSAWSEALNNHKAMIFDRANGLVGFCLNDYSYYDALQPAEAGAYIFDVSGDEISISGFMPRIEENYLSISDGKYSVVNHIERICYSGANYYYLQGGEIRAFDRVTFEEAGAIEL